MEKLKASPVGIADVEEIHQTSEPSEFSLLMEVFQTYKSTNSLLTWMIACDRQVFAEEYVTALQRNKSLTFEDRKRIIKSNGIYLSVVHKIMKKCNDRFHHRYMMYYYEKFTYNWMFTYGERGTLQSMVYVKLFPNDPSKPVGRMHGLWSNYHRENDAVHLIDSALREIVL